MNRILTGLLALLLGLASGHAVGQTAALQVPAVPDGLQTVSFFSPAVGREMKYDIVLPPGYQQTGERYPVLYLLHGFMQNYTIWGRNLLGAYYAEQLDSLILVMPDGGNSWFVNYATSPEPGHPDHWEDHVAQDVIAHVDANFRTEARREGRAIAGLSMGGFGALAMGFRHPELFVSVGSSSGALGFARSAAERLQQGLPIEEQWTEERLQQIAQVDAVISRLIDIPGFSTQQERTPKGTRFESAEQALEYDPFTIIYDVPKSLLPHVYLDAGTADSLIGETREMVNILMLNNVAFDLMQSPGGHNVQYWRKAIGHMVNIQNEVMQQALGKRP